MTDETYNGWKNRETWAASLHISNDEGLMSMATERLEGIDPTSFRLGEALSDWYDETVEEYAMVEGIRMMARDVGSAWRVDWQRVAEGLVEA